MKNSRPKIKPDIYHSETIQSVVGIKLSYYHYSYVKLEKESKTIVECNSSVCSDQKDFTLHPNLYETALNIVRDIPVADLYIIEEQLPFLKRKIDSNYGSKVSLQELQTSIISLLNIRKYHTPILLLNESIDESASNCVHLLRRNLIDDLFDLKIGSERVGLQDRLKEYFETHIAFRGLKLFEAENIDEYLRYIDMNIPPKMEKFAKEQLSGTIMMV